MATESSIRVGIAGLGLVAHSHLKGYRSHPAAEVLAVCDQNPARVQEFARKHEIGEQYTSFERMLANPSLNVIDIATPTHLHASMATSAAAAGKHVYCEKPFCRSATEGLEACRQAAASGVMITVGETYVFLSSHQKARELVEAGEIGTPLQIRQRHGAWIERQALAPAPDPADRRWRLDPTLSGGGEFPWIFDHAVHFFSSAEYLMLDSPIIEVFALAVKNEGVRKQSGAAHDPYTTAAIDIPVICWRHADAARHGVWTRAERLNGKFDCRRGFSTIISGERGMIEVLGEGGGGLIWDGRPHHVVLHREGRQPATWRFDEGGDEVWDSDVCYYSQGHINQIRHFVDCLLTGRPPRYRGVDGIRAVRCTLAAIRSARQNTPVRVEDVEDSFTAYGSASA